MIEPSAVPKWPEFVIFNREAREGDPFGWMASTLPDGLPRVVPICPRHYEDPRHRDQELGSRIRQAHSALAGLASGECAIDERGGVVPA